MTAFANITASLLGTAPVPPTGFAFLQFSDGVYALDAQGNYILVRMI